MFGLHLRSAVFRFLRNERGGIAIMSSAMFMVAITASALAIDLGSLYLERRKSQGIVDLAAMAAAGDLAHAEAAARATLEANGVDLSAAQLQIDLGHYRPDINTAVGARFQIGALPYNAARVTLTKQGNIFFAKTFMDDCCTMELSAMAANAQIATYSMGTRLASLREGAINGLIGGLLGGNVSLSLMDYNALISADVGLFAFSDALATELGVTGVTYDDLLQLDASAADIHNALSTVTAQNGNSTASDALKTINSQTSASGITISLESLLSYGPIGKRIVGQPIPGSDPQMGVMDIVSATATLANSGQMVSVNLGLAVPGLASLTLDLAIGEPMQSSSWAAVGQPEAVVHTAQTRLRLVAQVGGSGILSAVGVRVPLYVSAAYAEGRLNAIACAADGSGDVTIAAKPGIASASIGEVSDAALQNFSSAPMPSKATLVNLPLLKVNGQAHVAVTNTSAQSLSFSQAEIDAGTIKRVSTQNIVETLVTSLLSNLSLEISQLGPISIAPVITNLLAGVAAPLDEVIYSLLTTLGLRLGEVDVRVNGVYCGGSVLAG